MITIFSKNVHQLLVDTSDRFKKLSTLMNFMIFDV